ncbi:MAG TPA: hypothetical protein PLR74_14160, partial [Agriterribacter sp.]|nr:hypothetical protein [Agriterribacter sp.]
TGIGMMSQGNEDVSQTLEPANPAKCNDGGLSTNFGIESPTNNFGASIGLDCEGVSFELTGANLSIELGLDKKGGYTIYGGPKAGVSAGGTGVEVKTGAYVSGKVSGGTVDDYGVKIKTTASVGAGPVSVSSSSEQSISFAPGF